MNSLFYPAPVGSPLANHDSATLPLWVFGYGSLIWRPGFEFAESRPALVMGYHRALCVRSFVHRGTPERPGLVFGLDRGGACRGMAFRIAAGNEAAVIAYLREREQVTSVYLERMLPVQFESPRQALPPQHDNHPQIRALTYVVDRQHRQYAGRLPRPDLLAQVMGAIGASGANPDYVTQTHDALTGMGVSDATLSWLASEIRARTTVSG
jgi:glutathione-specific gamma-glutamylcyclotransferase